MQGLPGKYMLVCEGYLDVISMHQADLPMQWHLWELHLQASMQGF